MIESSCSQKANVLLPQEISAKQARPNGFRSLFTFSLRWKVTLSFSVLLLLIVGFLFLGFMWYERVFLSQESQKRAQSLANSMVINARDPLLNQDDLRLAPIIESVSQDTEVQYAYLMDHQGRIQYHSDPQRTGRLLPHGVPSPAKGIIQASVPIKVENVKVGTAVVGLGVDHIDQAMMQTATGLLLPLGLVAGVGIIGIFLLAGINVDRIKRLEEAVQALGSGDLLVRVEDSSLDEVGRLTRHFNEMVGQLHFAHQQNQRNFRETIRALAAAVEAKDAYTRGHCDRVARISVTICKRLKIDDKECGELEIAAILHDVGKIGVKAGIIGKLGPLTDEEFQEMQHHPDIGARILSPLSSLQEVGLFVRHHHENYDGSGYPDGLKEDEIPQASRIIHLVDAFDAMTTNRPYRKALSREEAFSRIKKGRGKQFDPVSVDIFFQLEEEGRIKAISEEVEQSDKQ
jgi:HD-GYP domain-containing protein (c-di-GMP phosphodiesterase class II)